MQNCDVKRIKKTKVCIGDRQHYISIQTRELVASDFDSAQPVETFITIRSQWCALETVSPGVARHAKINIDDAATHIFWTAWDSDLADIETGNHYVLHDSRRFKVLKVDNVNERNEAIAIQTTERGESSEAAAQA